MQATQNANQNALFWGLAVAITSLRLGKPRDAKTSRDKSYPVCRTLAAFLEDNVVR